MSGLPGRPGSAREDDAQDVAVPVVGNPVAEGEELGEGLRRVPLAQVPARARLAPRQRLDPRSRILQLVP